MSHKQIIHSNAAAWTGITGHLILAVFKGAIGLLCDSKALVADALFTASEAAEGLAEKFRLPLQKDRLPSAGRRTSSESKEPILTMILTVFLLMGAVQTAISAVKAMSANNMTSPTMMAGVSIVIAVALKEALFQFQYRALKKTREQALDSFMESRRFSLYSSIAVLVGVFGSMAGGALDIEPLLYLDPAAALFIACLILLRGYQMVTRSVYGTLVRELQEENAIDFIDTVQRVYGIIRVEDLKAHEYGHYIVIEVKVSVNPRISVLEAREITNRAKALLMGRFSHVSDVMIQALPYDPGYPYKSNHESDAMDIPTLLQ
ncbi:cation diffusion facilitator family transporter [Paenibacillus shirakamiensis]|uniref:Cation diffusion facilitator family transporter n=1 Tax=Paenibacillus shirakamiensis TaxID=1265935 RepID=A0ABS4JBB0_9BACL|nr:cation diffusion facilitator family transporter [Paenibacillus shirakamiensis]MBP1999007.1 cation diffusion facilitator family transporter [Paenibacillus shirakamiensis]